MTLDITAIHIPPRPGIYIMRDAARSIIYIGKAKNLKNRVRSYFTANQNYKMQKLVRKIADIEFVLTDSEDEAFLLESNMIKRHRPLYNIELKDQQRYTYLRVTDEEYPRLLVTRRTRDGRFLGSGQVYGPFTQGSSKLLTIGALRKAFKIRICKTLPKKACLEYHLGNCEAPCQFDSARDGYGSHVQDLQAVLKGGDGMSGFVESMRREMDDAAESQQYERAIEIRDTLRRLGSLRSDQKMEMAAGSDEDYFGVRVEDHTALIMTLKQRNGVIRDTDRFSFDMVADNTFGNFLFQYYTTRDIPGRIVVSEPPENAQVLESVLSRKAGYGVRIVTPGGGRERRMIALIMRNIDLIQSRGAQPGLAELAEALDLAGPPQVIECFDISNHGDDYAVGAMSRFVDGVPDRGGYRRFKIRGVQGRNDPAMISEVVGRRYRRVSVEGGAMPDLVLVDGGPAQLKAALDSLGAVGVGAQCASLAKREEEVFLPGYGEPVRMPRDNPALKVLQHARDEAHRFGVAYNRRLRKIR